MIRKRRIKKLAEKLFIALVANPERYKDMKALSKSTVYSIEKTKDVPITNEQITQKNINKAYKMAEQFINYER